MSGCWTTHVTRVLRWSGRVAERVVSFTTCLGSSAVSQCSNELFLKACGLSDSHAFALEVEGPGEGEVVSRTFKRPFALIGRDPNADLVLDHALVSSRHAYLQVIAGRVYCVDLGSRSGVDWEKGPERSGWVDQTWGICIGPYRIRAAAGMEAPNLEDPLAARSFGAPARTGRH